MTRDAFASTPAPKAQPETASPPTDLAVAVDGETATAPVDDSGLALVGISKGWRQGGSELSVLRNVDLRIPSGTVTWVGGANGAGKTTLLRIAAGILAADRGRVTLEGIDPGNDRAAYHALIGFLSAGDRGIYARLSVRRHLEFCARLAFLPRSERSAKIDAALADFELEELAARRADRLSLGQRQRIKLAMTFLHQPKLVLLDEPSSSLDDAGIGALREAVRETVNRRGSVLSCSPPGERTVLDSDRAFLIRDGRLVAA